jgi:hypothetical protein
MSAIVDLATWKQRHATSDVAPRLHEVAPAGGPEARPDVDRLERAVERLHALVSGRLDGDGRVEARVETELLAIMGELAVGLIPEAATRAERLAAQLAR